MKHEDIFGLWLRMTLSQSMSGWRHVPQVQELRRDTKRKSNGGMDLPTFRQMMLRVFLGEEPLELMILMSDR